MIFFSSFLIVCLRNSFWLAILITRSHLCATWFRDLAASSSVSLSSIVASVTLAFSTTSRISRTIGRTAISVNSSAGGNFNNGVLLFVDISSSVFKSDR